MVTNLKIKVGTKIFKLNQGGLDRDYESLKPNEIYLEAPCGDGLKIIKEELTLLYKGILENLS